MNKLAITIGFAALAGAAFGQVVLHDNGSVVNGTNNGNDISAISAPNSTFGYGAQTSALNRVADDFQAGQFWRLEKICFYAYQGSATAFSFTGADVEIRKGADINTASTVFTGSNLGVTQVGGRVAYRVPATAPTQTSRPIFKMDVDVEDMMLENGAKYWVIWSLAGSLSSGPWIPQVMNGAAPKAGNGQVSALGGAFTGANWGGVTSNTAEMPFSVKGSIVPEPGTMIALAAGIAAVAARRRRK